MQSKSFPNIFISLLIISISTLCVCGALHAKTDELAFTRPPGIKKAVDFWTRIYAEIDSNSGFIHDSRALEVIYEVYPLPTHASPKQQHRLIRQRIRHYQKLLRKIAKTPDGELSPEERRIKQLWGQDASPPQLRTAEGRVRFQRGQSDRMDKGLQRAAKYDSTIRKILRDEGVPEQLAALPHVESSYNIKAKSKVGAAGLWQIMPATGRRYLQVNHVVDERLDPYKATRAAAQLLKHNYSVLDSWPLAITAYNHGLSGVRRAVRKTGTSDIATIIQRYRGRAFKFASRNFYVAFLAAYDVSTPRRLKFREEDTLDIPIVTLNAYMPAAAIVEGLGISKQALKAYNPDLGAAVWSGEKYIPKSHQLRIPIEGDRVLVQAQVTTLEKQLGHAEQVPDRVYRVERGDHLGGIAQRHGTSIKTLVAMNNLRNRHRINAGQVLRIPKAKNSPAVATVKASLTTEVEAARNQTVPTVASVQKTKRKPRPEPKPTSFAAKRQAHSDIVEDSANHDQLTVEANEALPDATSELAADPADYLVAEDETIEVQVGETLSHYAHWLNLPTQQLRTLNGMRRQQDVIVGKRLRLAFSAVSAAAFEQKRKHFHTEIQNRFFKNHRIVDVKEHALTNGDNLWELSTRTYQVPLWLLRQYNPDLAFDTVLSLSSFLRVPVVQRSDHSALWQPARASGGLSVATSAAPQGDPT